MSDELARAHQLRDDGIAAFERGDREQARLLLAQAASIDPTDEDTFVWLAAAATDPKEKREALRQVLELNPDHQEAKAQLRKLGPDFEAEKTSASTPTATPMTEKPVPTPPHPIVVGFFSFLVLVFVGQAILRFGLIVLPVAAGASYAAARQYRAGLKVPHLPLRQDYVFVMGLIAVLGSLYLFGGSFSDSSTSKTPAEIEPTEGPDSFDALVMCQQFVTRDLTAPATADFAGMHESVVSDSGRGRWVVTSHVDSENGFGANVRTKYVCTILHTGNDKWRLESLITDP